MPRVPVRARRPTLGILRRPRGVGTGVGFSGVRARPRRLVQRPRAKQATGILVTGSSATWPVGRPPCCRSPTTTLRVRDTTRRNRDHRIGFRASLRNGAGHQRLWSRRIPPGIGDDVTDCCVGPAFTLCSSTGTLQLRATHMRTVLATAIASRAPVTAGHRARRVQRKARDRRRGAVEFSDHPAARVRAWLVPRWITRLVDGGRAVRCPRPTKSGTNTTTGGRSRTVTGPALVACGRQTERSVAFLRIRQDCTDYTRADDAARAVEGHVG